jgi:hypothetical protein
MAAMPFSPTGYTLESPLDPVDADFIQRRDAWRALSDEQRLVVPEPDIAPQGAYALRPLDIDPRSHNGAPFWIARVNGGAGSEHTSLRAWGPTPRAAATNLVRGLRDLAAHLERELATLPAE